MKHISNFFYLLSIIVMGGIFIFGCKAKDYAKICSEKFPSKIEYIQGETKIEYDTITVKGDSIPCPKDANGKQNFVKAPDKKVPVPKEKRVDTLKTPDKAKEAFLQGKINSLEKEKKETEDRLHSSQKQTLEALKIVDKYKLERNKARTQRNIAILGIGLLTLWIGRKILAKLISPLL